MLLYTIYHILNHRNQKFFHKFPEEPHHTYQAVPELYFANILDSRHTIHKHHRHNVHSYSFFQIHQILSQYLD